MNLFKDPSTIVVEKSKVVKYLLNIDHPDGFSKARIFIRFGFHPENWEDFVVNVKLHAKQAKVIKDLETAFGRKIVLKGILETPSQRKLTVMSVWMVALKTPILVTLYPEKR